MEFQDPDPKILFRHSVNDKKENNHEINNIHFQSNIHPQKEEQKSPSLKKKPKNLLDLIRVDPQAKLWQCILTSIVAINEFCEKGLKKELDLKTILNDDLTFLTLCREKQNITLQQIIFNRNSESEKESLLQIKSHSNPLRRLDSRDQKHKFFIEASLKKQNKIDESLNFNVKEYGYELFSHLRKINNITIDEIKESFNLEKNFKLEFNIANTSELFGKSGATFFFTHDNKYVLKSLSHGHAKTMITNFPKYFTHLLNNNEDSVMVRIYGMYKITVEGYEKIYFIMMENLTENLVDHLILRVYDLKGSKFQRSQENFKIDCEEQNKILKSIFGSRLDQNLHQMSDQMLIEQILIVRGKDNDFLDSEDMYIQMKKEDKLFFLENIQKDVKFFEQCNLMDYSLIFMKALKNHLASQKKNGKSIKKNEENSENEEEEIIEKENEGNFRNSDEASEQNKLNNEFEKQVKNNQNFKKPAYKRFRCHDSPDNKFVYSMAIVDYLQNYDLLKLMETHVKSIFQEKPQEISCIDAQSYGKRFSRFIISIIQSDI